MARLYRSFVLTKANNFMWRGFLYYGFTAPITAVTNFWRMMMGVGK